MFLLIIAAFLLLFTIIFAILGSIEDSDGLVIAAFLSGAATVIMALISICGCSDANFGEKTYTGYIYSVESSMWQTHGHIRFSENAGEDTQPSFCVADEDADRLRELAGSGKKVRVTIPDAGIVWGDLFKCKIPAQVKEVE